jgi:hypothetical protein
MAGPRDHSEPTRVEEVEIDQILADSFPASDAPPWTLGVSEMAPKTSNDANNGVAEKQLRKSPSTLSRHLINKGSITINAASKGV